MLLQQAPVTGNRPHGLALCVTNDGGRAGKNTGGNVTDQTSDQGTAQTPVTGDATGTAINAAQNGGVQGVTFTPEQQAKIDAIIADRLRRQEDKLRADAEAAQQRAQQEAEEARLAEQQQYQELADKRKVELEALKPLADKARADLERYSKALAASVEKAREGAPSYVIELLDRLDPVVQLEYLTAHAAEWQQTQTGGGPQGPPKTPKPRGDGQLGEAERRRRAYRTKF